MSAETYQKYAAEYDAENTGNLLNAHYERPAILNLAGDVQGRRILDAGCGSGPLTAELLDRGAEVTGFDASSEMIKLAQRRLGLAVPLQVHDLAEPLPYEDGEFDDVICSLVLHYLEDWESPLAEIKRVLKPGGRVIASVNHPFVRQFTAPEQDYFRIQQYTEDYEFKGQQTVLTFYHRPLSKIVQAFPEAGFNLLTIDEPGPAPETPMELLPPRIASGERTAFLSFLFLVAQKPQS